MWNPSSPERALPLHLQRRRRGEMSSGMDGRPLWRPEMSSRLRSPTGLLQPPRRVSLQARFLRRTMQQMHPLARLPTRILQRQFRMHLSRGLGWTLLFRTWVENHKIRMENNWFVVLAICRSDCHATRGYCDMPGDCKCRIGWAGRTCKECQVLPGCVHGYCEKPLECKCYPGYTGILCQTRKHLSNPLHKNESAYLEFPNPGCINS